MNYQPEQLRQLITVTCTWNGVLLLMVFKENGGTITYDV